MPKIKISENPIKITTPGYKKIYRLYNKENDKAVADYIALDSETLDDSRPLTVFDPNATWKRMTLTSYYAKELLHPIFIDGKCVYEKPSLKEISEYAKLGIKSLWNEYKRLSNPHVYKVDLSQNLYDTKQRLLSKIKNSTK